MEKQVYVLMVKDDGETMISVFKDNTQIKKKLIKFFNEQFNYDYAPEDRDVIIEDLFNNGYATGDMLNDFAEYYLEKQVLI